MGAAPPRRGLAADVSLRFPGSRRIRLVGDRLEDYEGRVEYWEAWTETVGVVAEPVGGIHEGTSGRLPHLVERIAMVRARRSRRSDRWTCSCVTPRGSRVG